MSKTDPRPPSSPFDYRGPESWMDKAACVGHDPSLWYPEDRGPASGSEATQMAKAICKGCDVKAECYAYAMETEPNWWRFGIWAGLTPDARRKLGKKTA